MVDIDDFQAFLTETLGTGKKDEEPKLSDAMQKKVYEILGYVKDNDVTDMRTVEVIGSRVGIETVQVHGLEITVDANGRAERVTAPSGFTISDPA